ncbi:schlafen family member 13-like [Rhinatrema bivittatum]|uniref:schlafen family member 13-like n=1 Tax=Rhinatrema bivittatum TaxID=194408 RepID=UPI00112691B1|nr:schlafen family member 13-like [Rhinatrema bivittatum]
MRQNMKNKTNKADQMLNIIRGVCALLNSEGGIVVVKIENNGYVYETDGLGQDIEESLQNLIISSAVEEYCSFLQQERHLYIFVKSWCGASVEGVGGMPRICSVESSLLLRSCSNIRKVMPRDAVNLLSRKSDVNCNRDDNIEPERKRSRVSDPKEQLMERENLKLNEQLKFSESLHVEFKSFETEKNMQRIKEVLVKYISAFANADGGTLFIGIDDKTRMVVGCGKNQTRTDLKKLFRDEEKKLQDRCVHICAEHGKRLSCDLKILDVKDDSQRQHGYVLCFKVKKFCCLVFADEPDSWIIKEDQINRLQPKEWVKAMMAKDPDLAEEFQTKLSISGRPPQFKPVFSKECLTDLQNYLYKVNSDEITRKPESLCEELFSEHPELKHLPQMEAGVSEGILIFSRSWAVDVGLSENPNVVCDALLIAVDCFPVLYTVCKDVNKVSEYSKSTAFALKQKLVNYGGYTGKLCVIPKVLCLQHLGERDDLDLQLKYPAGYVLTSYDVQHLLQSLVVVILGFRSHLSDQLALEVFNLLTIKQYELFSKDLRKCKKLFIHGLPGTGKTIVAMKIMEKIKNLFHCRSNEVLYICENQPLRNYVRQQNISWAVTRKSFMKNQFSGVKHIVIDEAQNFRIEDGEWYKKAKQICNPKDDEPGILWVFLDYFQMSHSFECGLPPLQRQNPYEMLTKVVRNTTQIYDNMLVIMKTIVAENGCEFLKQLLNEVECGHDISGFSVKEENLNKNEIAKYVAQKCNIYFQKGYLAKDIAILCSTTKEVEDYYPILLKELRMFKPNEDFIYASEIQKECIVLDSGRRFSGLERDIVFCINPISAEEGVLHKVQLCMISRARIELHQLYEKPQKQSMFSIFG